MATRFTFNSRNRLVPYTIGPQEPGGVPYPQGWNPGGSNHPFNPTVNIPYGDKPTPYIPQTDPYIPPTFLPVEFTPNNNPGIDPLTADPTGKPGGATNSPLFSDPNYTANLNIGGLIGGACNFLPEPAKSICKGLTGGGGNAPLQPPGSSCPAGYKQTANGCAKEGVVGIGQRFLPGGNSGYAWSATNGMYGAGVIPVELAQVSTRCPTGWVLGNDNVCYQSVERRFRKHVPPRRPLLSANDGRILAKSKSIEKKLKRVSSKHVHKSCNCARKAAPRGKK